MNKHHTFKTGLFISIFVAIILLYLGVFSRLIFSSKSDKKDSVNVALITDSSDIDDASYNQLAYEGIKRYCEKEDISYSYYKPADSSIESSLSSVDEAVKNGAEIIVCSDSLLSETVYQAQDRYEETNFILVDGEPVSSDGTVVNIGENVTSLIFDDDESGFLAGYSCVICGYKTLAVIYDSASTSDMHYYYGFLQGSDYAAKESGIQIIVKSRDINSAGNEYVTKFANKTYGNGTELIFTCNKDICKLADKQASKSKGLVMNAGGDMTSFTSVAGSVTKNISNAVYFELDSYYSGKFNGGNKTTFDTSNDGINLIINENLISDFPKEKYNDIYDKLSNNAIPLISDTTVDTESLNLSNITLKNVTPTDN